MLVREPARPSLPLGLCLLLCACSAGDPTPVSTTGQVEVNYWRHYHKSERDALLQLIARFERANPKIRVRLRMFPYDVYRTKVVATLSTGEGPDIINIHNSWAYGYIKSRLILPVPPWLFAVEDLDREFFPLMRSFKSHGAYYALPIGAGNHALFYNRAHFRGAGIDPSRPPRSWRELVTFAKRLTKRDERGRLVQAGATIGRPKGQGWNYFVEGVLRQAGVKILADDGRSVRWNTPAGAAALRWFTDFATRHRVDSVLFPEAFDAFRLGLSAMMIDGPWAVGHLTKVAPGLDYGTTVVPVSKRGIRATYGTAWGNAVTHKASGPARRAAWLLLKHLCSYESMVFWAQQTGELPMRRRVAADAAFARELGRLRPFLDQMDYSFASLKKSEVEYRLAITDAIDEILLRGVDPARALSRAARRVDEMLVRE